MYRLDDLQEMVEAALRSESAGWEVFEPRNLYRPIVYSLEAGGKRLRPVLTLAACQMFDDNVKVALPAALAVEIFHNFTLLHDDIMDKAAIRRNRPTVHMQFGENSAILSGDAMAFMAYRFLLKHPLPRLNDILALFTQTAIEVCEGQQYDMDFEHRLEVTTEEYLTMIRLKTAVLLGCALKTGAWAGNAPDLPAARLYEAGINLGMAFQLQDDLLDTFGDMNTFGKQIGGDIVSNKKTFLLISALEKANLIQKRELTDWLAKKEFVAGEKINAVRNIYSELHIDQEVVKHISLYHNQAVAHIESLVVEPSRKELLGGLVEKLLDRKQ